MEKIEYLAGYLPFKLKMQYIGQGRPFRGTKKVEELNIQNIELLMFSNHRKPILYPLSDYEKFDEILDEMSDFEIQMIEDNPNLTKRLSYDVIEAMFRNHIDIYGLIESGLAIDINTLK